MKKVKTCRSCGSSELLSFLSLGRLPLTTLIAPEHLANPEPRGSLEVAFCKRCSLVQTTSEPAQVAQSSFGPPTVGLLERLLHERHLGPHHLVLSVGGTSELLRMLMQAGVRVLHLEPQGETAKNSLVRGIPTRTEEFSRPFAQQLAADGLKGDVILANQALARHSDLNGTIEGLGVALKDTGVIVLELPYLYHTLEGRHFNDFGHQHLHYFSVTALHDLMRRHSLWLQRIEPIAEGYMRYFVGKARSADSSVGWYLEEEGRLGLNQPNLYLEFGCRVAAVREALLAMLTELRAKGRRIAALGATPQGNTLLNYVGLGREVIEFVIDPEPSRQGKYLSGMQVPTFSPHKLLEEQPDYLLLLGEDPESASIQYEEYLRRGGKLITPLPHPDILTPPALVRQHKIAV